MSENKVYKVMYKEDLEKLSRDELEYYAQILQIDLNIYITYTKDLEYQITNLKKKNTKLMYRSNFAKYRKRAHTYKVEMERYRRKLTRIYEWFNEAYQLAFIYMVMGKISYSTYNKVKDFIKELKNV